MDTPTQSTQIVILGGSGDLATRKLFPALMHLYARGELPEPFTILGVAHTPRDDAAFRTLVTESIETTEHTHRPEEIAEFCAHITYLAGDLSEATTYEQMGDRLRDHDEQQSLTAGNRLFYLAIPPRFYEPVFCRLAESHLMEQCEAAGGYARILVEKPFGDDLATAQALDATLSSLYREDQIYRIDHYLAKEAVQSILSFRFANTLLQPAWDAERIASVEIVMHETIGVGERGGFYEGVGALRDVGQNHLLQLLALIAMDEPDDFSADAIRAKRAHVLEQLQIIDPDTLPEHVTRAQYEGYRAHDQVADDSQTETFFSFMTTLDSDRWRDVPFYVEAGKALAEKKVEITITFRERASELFDTTECRSPANRVVLTIQPEQAMTITLNAKAPGLGYVLEDRDLRFVCCEAGEEGIENSYEKVLYDCIIGDQTLFTTTEEVLAAWRFITPILDNWQKIELHTYKQGSKGPHRS